MKAKSFYYLTIIALVLITGINTLSYESQEILNENYELTKICQLKDGGLLTLSTEVGSQSCKISELDIKGRSTKDNSTMNYGYTGSAQLVEPYPEGDKKADYLLFYHNKHHSFFAHNNLYICYKYQLM